MSQAPPPGEAALSTDKEAACWQAAKKIREERPGWVVIWIARTGQFKAYPKFAAPRGTAPTAQTADQLIAQMEQVEQAARRQRGRSQRPNL
jgi:hypothetical protein